MFAVRLLTANCLVYHISTIKSHSQRKEHFYKSIGADNVSQETVHNKTSVSERDTYLNSFTPKHKLLYNQKITSNTIGGWKVFPDASFVSFVPGWNPVSPQSHRSGHQPSPSSLMFSYIHTTVCSVYTIFNIRTVHATRIYIMHAC